MIRFSALPGAAPVRLRLKTLWPVARAAMTDMRAIRARMADDLNDIRRQNGCVFERDFVALGWTPDQVHAHVAFAIPIARANWSDTREALRSAGGALATALCGFAFVAGVFSLTLAFTAPGDFSHPLRARDNTRLAPPPFATRAITHDDRVKLQDLCAPPARTTRTDFASRGAP